MVILSKGCKPDKFESQNSLKLSFTNICGFCSNFVERESFLDSNSLDILALCETKLGWLNLFWHFLCKRILLLICMDHISMTCTHLQFM